MKWVLIVTAIINGKVFHTDPVPFASREECLQILRMVEQHPQFKVHNAKASCEKQ